MEEEPSLVAFLDSSDLALLLLTKDQEEDSFREFLSASRKRSAVEERTSGGGEDSMYQRLCDVINTLSREKSSSTFNMHE